MDPHDVTALLDDARGGDSDAVRRLIPLVYEELRRLAHHHRFRWRDLRSPGTASLVHEAYVRLVGQTQVRWESRAQFFYLASTAMRSILIDNARHFARQKRASGLQVPLEESLLASEARTDELLALDEALDRLKQADERLARIVECRFFGGLTVDETASALGISPATVKRGWTLVRAWLYQELQGRASALSVEPPRGEESSDAS